MSYLTINRRTLIQFLSLASVWNSSQAASPAELRIVSPFPPGASVDFWVRRLEAALAKGLPTNALVIYAPGASGIIAANQVQKLDTNASPAILIASSALFSQMPRLPKSGLNFDPNKAFQPISILWQEPFYLAVRADSPIQNLDDLWTRAKQAATAPSVGSAGSDTTGGLLMDHMARSHSLAWTHVPYKGMAEVVANLLGGHLDMGIVSYQPIRSSVESGKIRVLATTGSKRSADVPQVPSLREGHILDMDGSVWFGLFATSKTSPEVIRSVQSVVLSLLSSAEFRADAQSNGFKPLGLVGSEARRFIQQTNDAWSQVIQMSQPQS